MESDQNIVINFRFCDLIFRHCPKVFAHLPFLKPVQLPIYSPSPLILPTLFVETSSKKRLKCQLGSLCDTKSNCKLQIAKVKTADAATERDISVKRGRVAAMSIIF